MQKSTHRESSGGKHLTVKNRGGYSITVSAEPDPYGLKQRLLGTTWRVLAMSAGYGWNAQSNSELGPEDYAKAEAPRLSITSRIQSEITHKWGAEAEFLYTAPVIGDYTVPTSGNPATLLLDFHHASP